MPKTQRTREWYIYIPEEGDWPIAFDGDSPAAARRAYLKWAGRTRLPAGARIWQRPEDDTE